MRTALILVLAVGTACGCSGTISPEPGLPTIEPAEAIGATPRVPGLAIGIVRTGQVHPREAFAVSGGSWCDGHPMAHSAVLVRHPDGDLLFDTGLGSRIDEEFAEMPWWLRPFLAYEKESTVRDQLAAAGVDPDGVRRVVLSHLHWDHASGIEDFPHAEVWTTRAEHVWALEAAGDEPGYIASQFDGPSIRWRHVELEPTPYRSFDESADLFDDGSVVVVPMPGHTPGSLGMFVNLPSGRRLFFTGDTTWSIEGFRRPAHKFWLSSRMVDHDRERLARTIAQVHALMQADPELVVVPAHDLDVQATLGFFPTLVE